jgi:hypothetical protein
MNVRSAVINSDRRRKFRANHRPLGPELAAAQSLVLGVRTCYALELRITTGGNEIGGPRGTRLLPPQQPVHDEIRFNLGVRRRGLPPRR